MTNSLQFRRTVWKPKIFLIREFHQSDDKVIADNFEIAYIFKQWILFFPQFQSPNIEMCHAKLGEYNVIKIMNFWKIVSIKRPQKFRCTLLSPFRRIHEKNTWICLGLRTSGHFTNFLTFFIGICSSCSKFFLLLQPQCCLAKCLVWTL